MKISFYILFFITNIFYLYANDDSSKIRFQNEFEKLVIQHEGRLKPIDTFARSMLLAFSHKSSFKNAENKKIKASEWLIHTLMDPEQAQNDKIFKIFNEGVLLFLDHPINDKFMYSFSELAPKIQKRIPDINELLSMTGEERNLTQKKVISLYQRLILYIELTGSFSPFFKIGEINHEEVAKDFGVKFGEKISYWHLLKNLDLVNKFVKSIKIKTAEEFTDKDIAFGSVYKQLSEKFSVQNRQILSILHLDNKIKEKWYAPLELMEVPTLGKAENVALDLLSQIIVLYKAGKYQESHDKLVIYNEINKNVKNIDLEVFYNKADLFTISLACYIFSFILLIAFLFINSRSLYLLSLSILIIGALLHTSGLLIRMEVMGRPPVSNLYESIIFVGWGSVLCSLVLEYRFKNGLVGIMSATTIGSVLHFVGFSYAADGDTLGMLVAVLDSNFWLATHVVTITFGYNATLLAGFMGHIYLFQKLFSKDTKKLAYFYKSIIWVSIFALFFTTLGTILGGIWADQSWGRFWGWDPKENGALLIVLWLLMVIHGRLAGIYKDFGFCIGLITCNITVILAWFGVNLLGVGLHNYGFTSGILNGIIIFSSIEIFFCLFFIITKLIQAEKKEVIS